MIRPLRLLAASILCWLAAANAAMALPPVWVAHGSRGVVVMFGSIHLLPANLAWRPAELDRALSHANDLWFEIPIDPASDLAANRAALALGLQPQGHGLGDDLNAADRAHLARAARDCGIPVEGLDRLRPWLADVTLSVANYQQAGATAGDGVEHQIAASAPVSARRRAFETPAEQIQILASAPLPDQIASLEETLSELDEGQAVYERLVAAWMGGDVGDLFHQALEPMIKTAPGVYRSLVVERNRRWLEVIRRRLDGRGTAVVVVGVGHLIGPDGLPAMLRAQGIKVDGP